MNRSITLKEIEFVIEGFPKQPSPGLDSFIGEFYQTFKELTLVLHNLFQRINDYGCYKLLNFGVGCYVVIDN